MLGQAIGFALVFLCAFFGAMAGVYFAKPGRRR